MSHFTTVKTQMVDAAFLKAALADLGYAPEEGDVQVRGFAGDQTRAQIKVATRDKGYDIGFTRAGTGAEAPYKLVADWYGIRDVQQDAFVRQLTQRYAYHAARAKLEAQGFTLVQEERQQDGRVHLVLRRMA